MILRPVGSAPVQGVPDLHLLGLFSGLSQELLIDRLFHEEPSGRDAVLALPTQRKSVRWALIVRKFAPFSNRTTLLIIFQGIN